MATQEISNMDDIIDSRDVIAKIEELESFLEEHNAVSDLEDDSVLSSDKTVDVSSESEELKVLLNFMEEMKGNGGDEQWRGDWYPVTIIRDSHFENYAQELAEELDLVKSDVSWPYTCIDWEQAARELQQDYTSVEFDGVTYWVR